VFATVRIVVFFVSGVVVILCVFVTVRIVVFLSVVLLSYYMCL
jgi:hypothetical protein